MMTVQQFNIELKKEIEKANRDSKSVRFLIASKYFNPEEILHFYNEGVRDFGENRIQEAEKKMGQLPKDIRWHFLGHLQSNKVSKVKGNFFLIHSIDSLELAQKCSKSFERPQPILIQVKTTDESTKTGFDPDELKSNFSLLSALENLEIKGLMTLGPKEHTEEKVRESFRLLRKLKEEIGESSWELSMGMSQDYPIAIQEGATLLRIGRLLKSLA
jgi:pyridoxal phosphate enzyme (YggS family)